MENNKFNMLKAGWLCIFATLKRLCNIYYTIMSRIIGKDVIQNDREIEHIKSEEMRNCQDINHKGSLSPHTLVICSNITNDDNNNYNDNDNVGILVLPSPSKEQPLETADLDISDELIETPDATFDITMNSVLQHSFELHHSGLDDTTSYSATDLMLFASAVPFTNYDSRPKSVIIPRHTANITKKHDSSTKRHVKELFLRNEHLSLSLGNLTDLMIAAWDNDPNQVRKFLNSGQARLRADHGYSALMLAVRNRSTDVVFLLASRETGMQNDHGKTATMIAVEVCSDEMFNLLVGREPGYQDKWGTTALMHALLLGNLSMAERLTLYDLGKFDKEGRTALILAAYCGHLHLLPNLISEVDISGFTSLMYSVTLNDTIRAQQLLSLVGKQDALGRSALMYAAINGHFDAVQMLLPYEVCLQSNWGGTALIYAVLYGYTNIVELLAQYEINLSDHFGRTAYDHALNPMHTCIRTKDTIITILTIFQ